MLKSEFEFGEEILVTGAIYRHKAHTERFWGRIPHDSKPAIFLGAINLSNGTVVTENYGDEGYNTYFDHKKYIPGAWICEKGRVPRRVFLSDCHKVKEHSTCCANRVCVIAGYPENCTCNCHKQEKAI